MADSELSYYSVSRAIDLPKRMASLTANRVEKSELAIAFVESAVMARAARIF